MWQRSFDDGTQKRFFAVSMLVQNWLGIISLQRASRLLRRNNKSPSLL
jgi:hypothetical protein